MMPVSAARSQTSLLPAVEPRLATVLGARTQRYWSITNPNSKHPSGGGPKKKTCNASRPTACSPSATPIGERRGRTRTSSASVLQRTARRSIRHHHMGGAARRSADRPRHRQRRRRGRSPGRGKQPAIRHQFGLGDQRPRSACGRALAITMTTCGGELRQNASATPFSYASAAQAHLLASTDWPTIPRDERVGPPTERPRASLPNRVQHTRPQYGTGSGKHAQRD